MQQTNGKPARGCTWCERPAVVGVLLGSSFTRFCEGHRWVAAAAAQTPGAEWINLKPKRKARRRATARGMRP